MLFKMVLLRGFEMHFRSILLVAVLVFKTTGSVQFETSRTNPVDLNVYCIQIEGKTADSDYPLLLLHDLGQSLGTWNSIQQFLAQETGRKVCAADLRNHGDSPWSDQTNIEAMTLDIENYIRRENVARIDIIGHGLGGKVAIHYAVNNPERVNSLVIEDMRPNSFTFVASLIIRSLEKMLQNAIDKVPRGSNEADARRIVTDYLRQRLSKLSNYEKLSNDTAETLPIRCSENGCEWKTNWKVLKKDLSNRLKFWTTSKGKFNKPALFLYGEKSYFDIKRNIAEIRKMFSKAQFVGIQKGGHNLHGVHEEFKVETLKFLKK